MSALSARDRFLARVEQVRVRVPFDQEAAADLHAAQQKRQAMVTAHEKARTRWEESRKLAEAQPEEPDYSEVDQWIADADQKVNENSLVVVLQWRPKVWDAANRKVRDDRGSEGDRNKLLAEGYFLRAEELTAGEWVDADLSWDQLAEHMNDGEMIALGQHALLLGARSDVTPFSKPSKTSKKT